MLLLVSELYIYQNARCNDKKTNYFGIWSKKSLPFLLVALLCLFINGV